MRKNRKYFWMLLVLLFLVLSGVMVGKAASCAAAEATTNPVRPYSLDYDTEWLLVSANGNSKVYYSDEKMKEWYEAVPSGSYYYIDISWIKGKKDATLNLKGDKNTTIVPIVIPAQNTKLKVKINKANCTLSFENVTEGVNVFQWRKDSSYVWKTVTIAEAQNENSSFVKELQKMQIKGAKLYIRLPQTTGARRTDGTFDAGRRPSKEIKISVSKLKSAPKVKVDGTKLNLNTKESMEYSLDNGTTWIKAASKMSISSLAPTVLVSGGAKAAVNVLFRYAATEKAAASKLGTVTIPVQRKAPLVGNANSSEVKWSKDAENFYLTFSQASKELPYEYTIVKPEAELNLAKASWKSVTNTKQIAITGKKAPEGSKIYVRKKTIKESSTTSFELASEMTLVKVTYK